MQKKTFWVGLAILTLPGATIVTGVYLIYRSIKAKKVDICPTIDEIIKENIEVDN